MVFNSIEGLSVFILFPYFVTDQRTNQTKVTKRKKRILSYEHQNQRDFDCITEKYPLQESGCFQIIGWLGDQVHDTKLSFFKFYRVLKIRGFRNFPVRTTLYSIYFCNILSVFTVFALELSFSFLSFSWREDNIRVINKCFFFIVDDYLIHFFCWL